MLHFDNEIIKGEIHKIEIEEGLWIRKWKLKVLQNVSLNSTKGITSNRKFTLVFLLDPSLFELKSSSAIHCGNKASTIFYANDRDMHFSVVPKQPFYVIDITFTAEWLMAQFDSSYPFYQHIQSLVNSEEIVPLTMQPCTVDKQRILYELNRSIQEGLVQPMFVKARTYKMVCSFFKKLFVQSESIPKESIIHFEQVLQAETIICSNLQTSPCISDISRQVNMSVNSLMRHFKNVFHKSIRDYYLEKKLELAKKMIIEKKTTINKIAAQMGYNQASPFIEAFRRQYGYTPGQMREW
jgi:AraC-like DNA-binding protein